MEKRKNIITLLGICILLSLVNIFATYLIVDYKTYDVSNEIINKILLNEYNKFGGKENYDMVNKIQAESIPKMIEQYNNKKNSLDSQVTTQRQAPNSQINSLVIVDASKTIAGKKITKTKDGLYVVGNPDAKVSLIEYSDLECPYCNQFHYSGVIEQVLSLYSDKVNFIFKHYPLKKHMQAFMEAEASECVGEIGGADKFYTFIINTFANSKSTGTSYTLERILELVSKLGVDSEKVKSCLETNQFKTKIENQINEGNSLGVNSTPTIIIKDNKLGDVKLIPGTTNIEDFKSVIDLFLK